MIGELDVSTAEGGPVAGDGVGQAHGARSARARRGPVDSPCAAEESADRRAVGPLGSQSRTEEQGRVLRRLPKNVMSVSAMSWYEFPIAQDPERSRRRVVSGGLAPEDVMRQIEPARAALITYRETIGRGPERVRTGKRQLADAGAQIVDTSPRTEHAAPNRAGGVV